MLATGSFSVNQAVKAVAIARSFVVDDHLDFSCTTTFRPDTASGFTFALTKITNPPKEEKTSIDQKAETLKVSKSSNPGLVAGAIAKRVRESQGVKLIGIGPDCVVLCVKAITLARRYLQTDNLDISFQPQFVSVTLEDDRTSSAIQFTVLVQRIQA